MTSIQFPSTDYRVSNLYNYKLSFTIIQQQQAASTETKRCSLA